MLFLYRLFFFLFLMRTRTGAGHTWWSGSQGGSGVLLLARHCIAVP